MDQFSLSKTREGLFFNDPHWWHSLTFVRTIKLSGAMYWWAQGFTQKLTRVFIDLRFAFRNVVIISNLLGGVQLGVSSVPGSND